MWCFANLLDQGFQICVSDFDVSHPGDTSGKLVHAEESWAGRSARVEPLQLNRPYHSHVQEASALCGAESRG